MKRKFPSLLGVRVFVPSIRVGRPCLRPSLAGILAFRFRACVPACASLRPARSLLLIRPQTR
jgi:hypothetical protein